MTSVLKTKSKTASKTVFAAAAPAPNPSKPEDWLNVVPRLKTHVDEDSIQIGHYPSKYNRAHWTTAAVTFVQKLPEEEKEE
jgi:hypothetical protein